MSCWFKGLEMWASIPAARSAATSSANALAVMAMMGTAAKKDRSDDKIRLSEPGNSQIAG